MSEPRLGDAPFQSDLIAFAVAAATLLGAAAPRPTAVTLSFAVSS